MKRKKQRKTNGLEFTARPLDADCEQIITQKAKDRQINVFKKGHSRYRLYFICSEKKWWRFCSDIKDLCVIKAPVPYPAWLRKTMLRNLRQTAAWRLNPVRAKKALDILAAISAGPDVAPSPVHAEPAVKQTFIESRWSVKQAIQTLAAKIRQLAGALLRLIRIPDLRGKRVRICPATTACDKDY